jgi:BirA family biotin operon repressor/biotin-[acetyl-CoA-carboxylase] ligase
VIANDGLEAAAMRAAMPIYAASRIASLDIVDSIDSTNSELLRRETPARGIAALFAEHQTGGRGRQGRVWASPAGSNLYLSVARCFDGTLARLGGLSLIAGIAAAETLHALGADTVRVKWPNDLVTIDGDALRKLGGVLVEADLQDGRPRAVVGLGLNLRMPTTAAVDIDQPWTDLQALLGGASPPRNRVAAVVLATLAEHLDRFDAEGLATFVPRFAALDALHGAAVTATIGDRTLAGVAAGITDDGALRLRTDEGEQLLRAGEVSVRRRPPTQA